MAHSAAPIGLALMLRSEDGVYWAHAVTPGAADLAHAASTERGDVLIAVGSQGTLLRSTDDGRNWRAARNATTDTDLRAVVNLPNSRTRFIPGVI